MNFAVQGHKGLAEFHRQIERQPSFLERFGPTATQVKIICDKSICVDVNAAHLAEDLCMGGRSAIGFAGGADLDHCASDRAADGALNEGHALVVDQHGAREHAHRSARVEPMFDGDRGLSAGVSVILGRLFERNEVVAGLVGANPVPGLALRNIVLADVEQLFALLHLALRPIEDDAKAVLAVKKLDILEDVTLRSVRLGKAQQFAIAIQFRLPAGRQVALDTGPIEGGTGGQRAIGDDGPAACRRPSRSGCCRTPRHRRRRHASLSAGRADPPPDPSGRHAAAAVLGLPSSVVVTCAS